MKAANFIIDQPNHGQKKNARKMYSTHIEVKSVAMKDLLKP